MDGVDNNAYGTSNQGFSNQVVQLTPDAVGEFKVVTANASAEYGRSSGAVINATMKSGTNSIHGSAWEYLRNTSLNAVGFFKPAAGKPTLQRNQFGFTVGGPIVKNKAFFLAIGKASASAKSSFRLRICQRPRSARASFQLPSRIR